MEDINALFSSAELFGEAVFVSLLVENAQIKWESRQLGRLKEAVQFFWGEECKRDLSKTLDLRFHELKKRSGIHRLQVQGVISGLKDFSPQKFEIKTFWREYRGQEKGLKGYSMRLVERPQGIPDRVKLPFYVGSRNALKTLPAGFNEIVRLSHDNQVLSFSIGNIFFKRGNKFYFPKRNEMFYFGVGVEVVQEILQAQREAFEEVSIFKKDLKDFDFCYFVNNIRGIISVEKIDSVVFSNDQSIEKLNKIFNEKAYA